VAHSFPDQNLIAPEIKRFEIEAPKIAQKRKAGQFVIIRINEHGERIPLTISDSNTEKGTITIIVQGAGKTTKQLNTFEAGDYIQDVVGPLGKPSHIENFGTAISIGNGSNPIIQKTTPDLQFNRWGNIIVDTATMKTSKRGVFAGGDIVTGGATVILAMGAGRKAAKAIDEYLKSLKQLAGKNTMRLADL
jgi:alkyl hydroperoxide reductase subunit AhpF